MLGKYEVGIDSWRAQPHINIAGQLGSDVGCCMKGAVTIESEIKETAQIPTTASFPQFDFGETRDLPEPITSNRKWGRLDQPPTGTRFPQLVPCYG